MLVNSLSPLMSTRARRAARRFSTAAIAVALLGVAADARAEDPTKEQCISANEDAQTLRQKGRLQAARAQLLVCVANSCPVAIKDDCSQRLNDIETAIPTIVFTAKAGDGDVSAVKVTMDGTVVASRLDGSALTVEPGEHAFEFTTPGYAPVLKSFVLREGVKRRQEEIVFYPMGGATPPIAAGAAPPPPVATEPPPVGEHPIEDSGNGRRILSYVLGGAGIVSLGLGAYFGLKAKSTYDDSESHCRNGVCDSEGVTGGDDASTQAAVSTVAFVAGGALLAGGIILFLTAPKDGGVNLQPAAASNGGGLRLGGTW